MFCHFFFLPFFVLFFLSSRFFCPICHFFPAAYIWQLQTVCFKHDISYQHTVCRAGEGRIAVWTSPSNDRVTNRSVCISSRLERLSTGEKSQFTEKWNWPSSKIHKAINKSTLLGEEKLKNNAEIVCSVADGSRTEPTYNFWYQAKLRRLIIPMVYVIANTTRSTLWVLKPRMLSMTYTLSPPPPPPPGFCTTPKLLSDKSKLVLCARFDHLLAFPKSKHLLRLEISWCDPNLNRRWVCTSIFMLNAGLHRTLAKRTIFWCQSSGRNYVDRSPPAAAPPRDRLIKMVKKKMSFGNEKT